MYLYILLRYKSIDNREEAYPYAYDTRKWYFEGILNKYRE